jgi:hypothetical protein
MKGVPTGLVAAALAALVIIPAYPQTDTVLKTHGDPTGAAAINNAGAVTGLCDTSTARGYVRAANGTVTTFDLANRPGTHPTSINDCGVIAGYFSTDVAQSKACGFIRDTAGKITKFTPAGVTATYPYSINDSGIISGTCRCAGGSFKRSAQSHIKLLNEPNYVMFAAAVRPHGIIVGELEDSNADYLGFERTRKGTVVTISGTSGVNAINASGVITVEVGVPNAGPLGFVQEPGGSVVQLSGPGSTYTAPATINAAGTVAGTFLDSSQYSHGSTRDSEGDITVYDAPMLGEPYTYIMGIFNSGVMCGTSDEGAFVLV